MSNYVTIMPLSATRLNVVRSTDVLYINVVVNSDCTNIVTPIFPHTNHRSRTITDHTASLSLRTFQRSKHTTAPDRNTYSKLLLMQ